MTSTAVPLMLSMPVVNSWLVMKVAGFYWKWAGFTGNGRVLLEMGGFYWKWAGFTGNQWCVLEMSGVWWRQVVCGGNGPKWAVGGLNRHCQQVSN